MKKEQPVKKKSGMKMPLGMKRVLLLVLLALAAGANAFAEHQEGVVTNVRRLPSGLAGTFLNVHIDTDGNRMADTILEFGDPRVNGSIAQNLEVFVERGMIITFDDTGFFIDGNMKLVNGNNTKTIDGSNMLDLFPNEAARFKYAAEARQRAQTQATQSPPTPAAQETAEERRIRELEEELRRLREGR